MYHGPRTAKYSFNPDGIDFGIRSIEKSTSSAILIIDEIGHLELRGEGFAKVPELIKARKVKDCILVIRKELLPAFLSQLDAAPLIFETTMNNRNQLPQEIGSILLKQLRWRMTELSELIVLIKGGGEVASGVAHTRRPLKQMRSTC